MGTELLVLVRETLHAISDCLGRSTWCPGCKAIAVMGAGCKEHVCDCVREEYTFNKISRNVQKVP